MKTFNAAMQGSRGRGGGAFFPNNVRMARTTRCILILESISTLQCKSQKEVPFYCWGGPGHCKLFVARFIGGPRGTNRLADFRQIIRWGSPDPDPNEVLMG